LSRSALALRAALIPVFLSTSRSEWFWNSRNWHFIFHK
jgi:hypothetical protein